MSLGNNIRKIRENKNISIDEMVKKIALFKQTYINIEKGLIKPKPNTLLKIANVFNLSESDIINYKEEVVLDEIRQLNIKNLKDIIATVDIQVKVTEPQQILTPITNTPINVVLEDLSVKEVIYKKPILLTSSELYQLGDNIKTVEVKDTLPNQVFINTIGELDPSLVVDSNRSFSSRLLNWVEPYVINGVKKTLFYTELNTNLKVGDKVFIVNGIYDSNTFLQENKYKRKVDGYEVLFVDNCRIALDIDYTDSVPFIDEPIDKFMNIYYIERKGDFLQANRQITSKNGEFGYKFSEGKNNIVFFNGTFSQIDNEWGESSGITERGFYVKRGNNWDDITNDFITGSFSSALHEDDNIDRIKIHNGTFTYSVGPKVVSFVEGLVYKWELDKELDGVSGIGFTWVVDTRYNTPFITKSNFRKGDFNGIFNSGVFGTQERRITWNKDYFKNATWNTGVLLNTNWLSGEMNSINSLSESYISEFNEQGIPYQKVNAPNNNGRGFNYIENSSIVKSTIENGVFYNSSIGQSLTYSTIDQYVTGSTASQFDLIVNKAIIERSNILGSFIKNTDVINSRVLNTKLENVKSVNSNYKLSVIKDSIYISDDVIKITGYDEFAISEKDSINSHTHKIYKFYISENDYKKLKIRDRFYIKGLRILDNSRYPLNFFDRRFRLSSWTEYFDSYQGDTFVKRGVEVGAFLSTPKDNEWKLNYIDTTPARSVVTEINNNKDYSIDIIVSTRDINGVDFNIRTVSNELPINGISINKTLSSSIIGKPDKSLNISSGFNDVTNVVRIDSEGKLLIGGKFTSYRGTTTNRIVRLNSDGTIDTTFNTGIGDVAFDDEVFDIHIVPGNNYDDYKILVGGRFNNYKGLMANKIIMLNYNGSVDETFDVGIGFENDVLKIKTHLDKVLVVGRFNEYNGLQYNRIIKLNSNGSVDTSFVVGSGFDDDVYDILVNNDKYLVAGKFTSYTINTSNKIIRLNSDGSVDTTFTSNFSSNTNEYINTIDIDSNGNIYAGGLFDYNQFLPVSNLVKLLDNGNQTSPIIDPFYTSFTHSSLQTEIKHVKVVNNKLYVLGTYNLVGPIQRSGIERLNLNGLSDISFTISNRFDNMASTHNLAITSDNLYVVGSFSTYDNQQYKNLVKINLLYSEPNTIGNNVDISSAYIINSDFESGIVENTDWIGGNHINYNNDVNIVSISVTQSIGTQSSELIVTTGYNAEYKESGDDCLEVGNVVFLGNIEYQNPTGDYVKLGDTYKIIETFGTQSQLILQEVGNSIVSTLVDGGTFSTPDAQNRYNYIYKAKIDKSKILSGIFRRAYITRSFIENESYDVYDRNFNNVEKIKQLVISDSLFKNNENILSKALYINSSFVSGNDRFENGIVYNSIWNGMKFNRGLFKESRWVDGDFNSGVFYNNRSLPGAESVKSYYKDGIVGGSVSNDRYNWQSGNFNDGEFIESNWENGNFNGGRFYYSDFYGGNINGGFIGDRTIPVERTVVHNATISFTTVDNASFESSNQIIWENGIFNGGEFKSNGGVAIWKNGTFNSGNFEDMAIWENGTFNGGRFLSTYGWTMSDSYTQSDYTWQNGQFNGGEFGNASGASNSTWFTGEFNGGKFVGRVWNNGILTNGEFIGSATYSAIRGVTATESNASLFNDSFTSSYYGLWRNGIVSDKKDEFIKDRQVINPNIRIKARREASNASILNSLWLGGTFSHSSGIFQNSVWLDGIFEKGTFYKSSFNPYVKRNGMTQSSFQLEDSCHWLNGILLDSDFFISKWEKGKFDTGDAYGMIWKDGVSNYMNAFNIFWERGLWRNGNWYGSYINYNGTVEEDFYKQILLRGASWSGTQSMHLWNIFDNSSPASEVSSGTASEISNI